MKIKKEYEIELVNKTQYILDEEIILNLQTVCLNLELMNNQRMEEMSDLTMGLHSKLMMIRNELEKYKMRINDTAIDKGLF